MRSRTWIFLGDVCIPRHVVFPCAVPIGETSKPISFEESRRMGSSLASTVRPNKYVTDSATIYHSLYSVIPTSAGAIDVVELTSRSRVVGGVCEVMKNVPTYSISFSDENKSAQYTVYPVIVVYRDGVWENVSLAPAKELEGSVGRVYDEYMLGIIEVPKNVETMRPYAHTLLINPTTLVLKRKCNLAEGKRKLFR